MERRLKHRLPNITGLLVISGLGTGFALIHALHAVQYEYSLLSFTYGVFLPSLLALSLIGGSVWLWSQEVDTSDTKRVGVWALLGAVMIGLGTALTILYEGTRGVDMAAPLFIISNSATGGALLGFIIGVYDVRRQAASDRANQLSKQLGVLNRVLRHDIRNDANVIQGNASLILSENKRGEEHAKKIQKQAADLVRLGEQARTIERMLQEGNKQQEPVDLVPVINRCCDRLERDYPEGRITRALPDRLLVTTTPLIDSAFRNVIENALEHTNKATPQVKISAGPCLVDGEEYVEVRIADNGPGIPEKEIEVLDRGFETDLEHTSGVGLWLANWLVTETGGHLTFEENAPEGAVVCLRFELTEDAVNL